MHTRQAIISSIIAASLLSVGSLGYFLGTYRPAKQVSDAQLTDTISGALKKDEVVIRVYDSAGNMKSEQKTHNIITSAGAIWFCIEQNRCTSQITGTTPAIPNVAGATWWVQFVSGTTNTNKPTGTDCTAPSGGGAISCVVASGRCITDFGSAPAQYQAGGSVVTVSTTAGANQLRGTGTFDSTNNFVQTTRATVCSIVNDGTAPSSGTCQFTDTTPVLTNMSGSSITVNGLALASGTASATVAGPLIIAESTISATTLAPGDTISVSWTIVT